MEKVILNDGFQIDQLGFGTYKLNGVKGSQAIQSALQVGYRVLDTAYNYENEGAVGKAIEKSQIPREDITIISKLPGRYQAYDDVFQTIQESIYRLGGRLHWMFISFIGLIRNKGLTKKPGRQ